MIQWDLRLISWDLTRKHGDFMGFHGNIAAGVLEFTLKEDPELHLLS